MCDRFCFLFLCVCVCVRVCVCMCVCVCAAIGTRVGVRLEQFQAMHNTRILLSVFFLSSNLSHSLSHPHALPFFFCLFLSLASLSLFPSLSLSLCFSLTVFSVF